MKDKKDLLFHALSDMGDSKRSAIAMGMEKSKNKRKNEATYMYRSRSLDIILAQNKDKWLVLWAELQSDATNLRFKRREGMHSNASWGAEDEGGSDARKAEDGGTTVTKKKVRLPQIIVIK
eukprot:Nk52_evm1s2068 gene=Nk52_evmTU1s2068